MFGNWRRFSRRGFSQGAIICRYLSLSRRLKNENTVGVIYGFILPVDGGANPIATRKRIGSRFGFWRRGARRPLGQSGKSNFLSRTTAILATVFFLSSLTLSLFLGEGRDSKVDEILENSAVPAIERQSDKSEKYAPTRRRNKALLI